ncbi:MAG TPA: PDZ domain-containing protein [Planctomycetota bacterium]|nr:PDZ domain-containing protein [Planctomycetota bacterium]
MTCMRYIVPIVTALGAVLSPAQDQPQAKNGVVVVEHGDDRVEVRFVPDAAHPQVLINGNVVSEGKWRVEGGEHRLDAGTYRLRVEAPEGGWRLPLAYRWPSNFDATTPTLLEWSKHFSNADANAEPEPYIGVQVGGLPAALADQMELDADRCVLVISATDGGPAAAAGLEAHDIVTAIDGVEGVTDAALSEAVNGKKPGDTLTLTVLRHGKKRDVAIEVGKQTRANWWLRNWQKEWKANPKLLETTPWLTYTSTDAPVLAYGDYLKNAVARRTAEPRDESLQQQIDEIRKLCERLERQLEANADGAKKKDGAVRR